MAEKQYYRSPQAISKFMDVVPVAMQGHKNILLDSLGYEIQNRRFCPYCQERELPNAILTTDVIRICMAGFTSSGKSQYITSVLFNLEDNAHLGISLGFSDTVTSKQKNKIIKERGKANEQTTNVIPLYMPIIGKGNVIFYDMAGEAFKDINTLNANGPLQHKSLSTSNNIILILDPFSIPALSTLDGAIETRSDPSGSFTQPLDQLMNILGINLGDKKRTGKLKNYNIALVISKIDYFLPAYTQEHPEYPTITGKPAQPSPHESLGRFDHTDADIVDGALVVDFLAKNGVNNIKMYVDAIEQNGGEVRLFAVSSGNDKPIGDPERIEPHRALDPFFWILYKNQIID